MKKPPRVAALGSMTVSSTMSSVDTSPQVLSEIVVEQDIAAGSRIFLRGWWTASGTLTIAAAVEPNRKPD